MYRKRGRECTWTIVRSGMREACRSTARCAHRTAIRPDRRSTGPRRHDTDGPLLGRVDVDGSGRGRPMSPEVAIGSLRQAPDVFHAGSSRSVVGSVPAGRPDFRDADARIRREAAPAIFPGIPSTVQSGQKDQMPAFLHPQVFSAPAASSRCVPPRSDVPKCRTRSRYRLLRYVAPGCRAARAKTHSGFREYESELRWSPSD